MAKTPPTVAIRTLNLELKKLQEEPVEGFTVNTNDDNLFHWNVAIFGPPETLYQGGYFKAEMKFPYDYPYSPPSFKFVTKMWHPNIYDSGDVCISILHPPVDDPRSGELASERWNPTQSVRTILLSVISLLNEPNTFSPANVDASVMYRRWKESKGKEKDYENMIRKQVQVSKEEAVKDGVTVPVTVKDYCIKSSQQSQQSQSSDLLDEDFAYDDDYDEDSDEETDEDDEDGGNGEKPKGNEDDSGNEET